ncbi:MAG: 50S ribosomal protein L27 [Candidatus Omnitrophica bacterium]|nr:50S ribosomal protein L27 [Candidatus Omnitrophota bacterium]
MAFKGTHNVASHGSRAWRQRIKTSPKQKVNAGAILVLNTKSLKCGENTYLGSNNIHAKIDGIVEIKNKKINVKPLS